MIVLDTNVVSELMRNAAEPAVVRWVDAFDPEDVFLTAVTAAELVYGVARLPMGRRQERLSGQVNALLAEDFADQVLPFDELAAAHYADIVVSRERSGRPISMGDAQTAAICRQWSAGVATRNVADFTDTGIDVINPWE
ncbi:type II toxin-antitoxin system VapC family toxin [Mycobacterium talmoniae]|uniref:Ribonuclease VapC n=1 Tax=Mycobacterium talmoniae TaxID=1858794 RepID=A0A1S1NQE8_9MYCO|nr:MULTISPECIES: type II toxin-antitoxin system VapC family toxin [Mycobacterium]OHV06612.1 VapC toxin family PIN domain ribonuclease [Mycobacterium talmoniae]PQM49531.1 Toxin FitB [Mycobacterium talmoniae]TDH55515.1 type II toxin-antitoxin system VapC family toxin [Mycobacterium eburneum]